MKRRRYAFSLDTPAQTGVQTSPWRGTEGSCLSRPPVDARFRGHDEGGATGFSGSGEAA
jgi:hypothetical protein